MRTYLPILNIYYKKQDVKYIISKIEFIPCAIKKAEIKAVKILRAERDIEGDYCFAQIQNLKLRLEKLTLTRKIKRIING